MLDKLLFKLTARLPCKLIYIDGRPYNERYYLGTLLGVVFYLHRYVSSDPERHLHNHPWTWGRSWILCGHYIEERVIDLCPFVSSGCLTEINLRRWYNRVDCNTFHRLSSAEPGTWTLFMHGDRVRLGDGRLKGWGFLGRRTIYHPTDNSVEIGLETVFECYTGDHQIAINRWWETALLGVDIDRVPFGVHHV